MRVRTGLLIAAALAVAGPAQAQTWQKGDQGWCDEEWGGRRESDRFCEVRTTTIAAVGNLDLDGRANGGITVRAWDRNEVEVRAKVWANARSGDRAEEIARDVAIQIDGGRIRADGPRAGRHEGWGVGYEVRVPRNTDLTLRTTNGGIGVEDVSGSIDFRATNGGVHLTGVAGDVRGHTTNGGLHVELAGDRWSGTGMDVETTNGGITLVVPEDYSAELVTGTRNGGIDIDFPVMVRGRIGRQLRTTLGEGGPTVRAVTTNGGVKIVRR
jgi:DUF4097 and DUF4098 domain-containing protein YvlB